MREIILLWTLSWMSSFRLERSPNQKTRCGMKIEGVKRKGYTMFYKVCEAGVDFEPSDGLIAIKSLEKYSLHDGYKLWKIEATYSVEIKPCFYYVVAVNSAAAVNRFLTVTPWLSKINSVRQLIDDEAEWVLENPMKHLLW